MVDTIKAVIDTDPGADDALALMMALAAPRLNVLGLTTVGGNASLANTTRNALRLLHYLGRGDVPVSRGAGRPLEGAFQYAPYYHGRGGLTVRLPRADAGVVGVRAADYLISLASAFRGELTIIALGPLTNVARAIDKEPRVARWVKDVVVMGGAVEVPGNVTPHAEFNIFNDPKAADVVFCSGVPVTLVGLDVCNDVYFETRDIDLLDSSTASGNLQRRIISAWFALHPESERFSLCDPLAVAAALRPDLMTYRTASVRTEATDQARLGKTTASYGSGPVKVASAVRAEEAKSEIIAMLRRHPA
ncbi:MAG: nucleoside hydrolase [Chloroflexi bacterium]|nr:nucleoside hydrolase [Chloroflexota bacterium]